MGKIAYVEELPNCEICSTLTGRTVKAGYDAKTIFGVWAYLCEKCFTKYGVGLGTGKGQKLKVRKEPDLELRDLSQYYGTLQYHNVMNTKVTDGIIYIMQNGYSWFVTDALAVIKFPPKKLKRYLEKDYFLSITLELKDGEATMKITDGNYNVLYQQHYTLTDAKRELKLFYDKRVNVLMLSSEY